ncbi:MAG: hypothetical protein K8T89_03625 [Planctomycetes bacterium]|nr:hypothetical protein [Planctomycetota bacterium]
MKSQHELITQTDGRYELTLKGSFPFQWPGNLASALAALRINVISGVARKENLTWQATFKLDCKRYLGTPDRIDFTELAKKEPDHLPEEAIRLSAFTLQHLPSGELEAIVCGPDQIGFLARFLRRISILGLFPRSFELDTVREQVRDRFVLGCIGTLMPPPSLVAVLNSTLQTLVATHNG